MTGYIKHTSDSTIEKRKAFTLVEIIVVIVVIGVLSSLLLAALSRMGAEARAVECMNNLTQIAQTVEAYYADHLGFPGNDLKASLMPYLKDEKVFECPEDPKAEGDSYSKFYIARHDDDVDSIRLCCPRHNMSTASALLFGGGRTVKRSTAKVKYGSYIVDPGDVAEGGTMEFEDGSRVTISPGTEVQLITSIRKSDGKLYSIIRVGLGQEGNIDVQVTSGARFEVVTPAAIAGVRGTRFQMYFRSDDNYSFSLVEVSEGSVEVRPLRKCICLVDRSAGSDAYEVEKVVRKIRKPKPVTVTEEMQKIEKYLRTRDKKRRKLRHHRFVTPNGLVPNEDDDDDED